jgi:peptidoglycan hydrolase-like protein with peptidoglycan-binding domain
MKASNKVSIFSYIRSFILFRLFKIKSKFYYLLLCSSAPLLLGFPNVASATEQQIAQAVPVVGINRPSLKVGSQGEVVSELQAALKLLGFYNGAIDGKFNDVTATAVTQFKQAAGLTANSVVDVATWQRLFPGETNISSNAPLPSPTSSGFPVPTQAADDLPKPVVISNPASTSERRPAVPRNSGKAQQLETVRPSPNRVSSTRPVQNSTSTSTINRTSTTNRSERSNNSSNSSASATSTTTTNRSRRTNNSSANTSNTTGQKAGIQYTAAGLPILRLGMRGAEVLELQEKLQRLGYLKTNPDGDFGAETLSAVKALQERHGMEPDGVAGGATWDILNRRRNRSQS